MKVPRGGQGEGVVAGLMKGFRGDKGQDEGFRGSRGQGEGGPGVKGVRAEWDLGVVRDQGSKGSRCSKDQGLKGV